MLNIRDTVTITQARKNIFTLTQDVQTPGRYITLTEKGCPKAVLLSAEEFESWIETLAVMHDFPSLKKDIAQARKAYKRGECVTLKEMLRQKKYAVSSRPSKKSRKRSE